MSIIHVGERHIKLKMKQTRDLNSNVTTVRQIMFKQKANFESKN